MLDRVRSSAVDDVIVVIGAHQVATQARTVKCLEWERGPGASLRCGLDELSEEVEAAVVVLADGPNLHPYAIDRVISVWRNEAKQIVVSAYGGERLHPVLIERSVWDAVPDEGLRDLPAQLVECGDLGAPGDVDTPADLR